MSRFAHLFLLSVNVLSHFPEEPFWAESLYGSSGGLLSLIPAESVFAKTNWPWSTRLPFNGAHWLI